MTPYGQGCLTAVLLTFTGIPVVAFLIYTLRRLFSKNFKKREWLPLLFALSVLY